MKLLVGLGNPGAKYARNRHNIGFMALDRIASDHDFAPWRAKHQGTVSEGRLNGGRAILLKPETFMNNSGQSVQAAIRFYKLEPADLIVLHDEIDLEPGKVKYKTGGGHAGHNGLRSVHAHIGSGYARIRLGVGHPGHKDAVPGYVLRDFPKAEEPWLDEVLGGVSEGIPHLINDDSAQFLNAVALRVSPPRSGTGQYRTNKTKPANAAQKPEQTKPQETPAPVKSPLQKLIDRFR
ncbi:MAG: aminoacyl-tRNA hydrolase [Pseudomonadota bacterium]